VKGILAWNEGGRYCKVVGSYFKLFKGEVTDNFQEKKYMFMQEWYTMSFVYGLSTLSCHWIEPVVLSDIQIGCKPVVLLKENCALNLISFGQYLVNSFKFNVRLLWISRLFSRLSVRAYVCCYQWPHLVIFFLTQASNNLVTKYGGEFPTFSHFVRLETSSM
jgi:hypothetical protein